MKEYLDNILSGQSFEGKMSEDEFEAAHHNELRQYRRLYLDYFSEKEAK